MKKLGILFGIFAMLVLVVSCIDVENTKKSLETKNTSTQTTNQTQVLATPSVTPSATLVSMEIKSNISITPSAQTQPPAKLSTGKVVFAVTDEAVAMNEIQSVKLTVSSISVRKRGGELKVVNVIPVIQDIYLLKENGQIGLLSEVELEEGNYDRVRLILSNVKITTMRGEEKNAETPGNVLQLSEDFQVNAGKTSSVLFDFNLDKSVHKTAFGRFLFIPVVKYETKTDVTAGISGTTVGFAGGKELTSKTYGMTVDGKLVENYELSPNTELKYIDGEISEGSQTKVDTNIISKGINASISRTLQDSSKEKVLGRYSRN